MHAVLSFIPVALLMGALVSCSSSKQPPAAPTCLPPALEREFRALPGGGSPVRFSKITKAASLEAVEPDVGGAFFVQDGDYLIENDRIRAVIQQPSRQFFLGNYGGTLIAVDEVDESGKWHDFLGELSTLIGLGYFVDVDRIETIRDGSDGVLIVAASGPLERSDWINLEGMAAVLVSNLMPGASPNYRLKLPWSLRDGIPATVTHYYTLSAGSGTIEYDTAICNTGDGPLYTATVDLLDTGGTLGFLNFNSTFGGEPGFGSSLPFGLFDMYTTRSAFVNDLGGYGLRFTADTAIMANGGMGIILNGARSLLPVLESLLFGGIFTEALPPGIITLAPGASTVVTRQVIPFREPAGFVEENYRLDATPNLATIRGTVRTGGNPVAEARVALLNAAGAIETILIADKNGAYKGRVAPGSYTVHAEPAGGYADPAGSVNLPPSATVTHDIELAAFARLRVEVMGRDSVGAGAPARLPAKVSLVCSGECPRKESRLFRPTTEAAFEKGIQLQAFVDQLGLMHLAAKRGQLNARELRVPPGQYRLVVSRGMEYSRFETDVTLLENEALLVEATIDRVIDSTGWISADFHVHTVNSPDSSIPLIERVLTFAGEGVDVLVATDHDFITDIQPTIDMLGLQDHVRGVIGAEMTFSDYAHFNAYPMTLRSDQIQNGAVDGGGGRGPTLTPQELFAATREIGAGRDTVIQINHARSVLFGYFASILLNTATLKTQADPTLFQMDPSRLTESDDDTGLFSDDFDAFELYNLPEELYAGMNDYFALLNLGLRKTAVASSDTHDWYANAAGSPRSFLYVGAEHDRPSSFDQATFVKAVHAGRLMGTNGPFLRVNVQSVRTGASAGIGGTVDARDGVRIQVDVEMPEWMDIDTIEVFSNTPDVAAKLGDSVNDYPRAKHVARRDKFAGAVTDGVRRYTWTVEDACEVDCWYMVVARDDTAYGDNFTMSPVVPRADEFPFAYTNAFFADVDGDGKFTPPGVVGKVRTGSGVIPSPAPVLKDVAPENRSEVLHRVLDKLLHH